MLLNVPTHQAHQYRTLHSPTCCLTIHVQAVWRHKSPRYRAEEVHSTFIILSWRWQLHSYKRDSHFLTFSVSYAHHCAVFCLIFKPVHTLPLLSWYFSATTRKYTYRNLTLYCLKVTRTPIPVAQKSKQPLTKARLAHQALEACPASPPLKRQLWERILARL